jgi:hypothetical protein
VLDGEGEIVTDGLCVLFTLMTIELELAEFGFAHTLFDVINTETISPLFRVVEEKVGLLIPTLIPFIAH